MCVLNIYLVVSLTLFLRITKDYIDSHSHLFVVCCFVAILVFVNHYSDAIECFIVRIENQPHDALRDKCMLSIWQYCSICGIANWIKKDYSKSKTKRTIDYIIKYFLFTLQNTDGHKT